LTEILHHHHMNLG